MRALRLRARAGQLFSPGRLRNGPADANGSVLKGVATQATPAQGDFHNVPCECRNGNRARNEAGLSDVHRNVAVARLNCGTDISIAVGVRTIRDVGVAPVNLDTRIGNGLAIFRGYMKMA